MTLRIASFLAALFYTSIAYSSTPVATSLGPVVGVDAQDASVEVFKGIPYAAPPVGDLRWRPPAPASEWSEVRRCDKFGPKSLQKKQDGVQSEDCLYLNIWRLRTREEKLPVMVWIHGGGFTQGSGHQPGYDGTRLAKRGVILVTLNYRLGALGFMTHPELSAESPQHSSGNYGILDQIAALKWVRENIEQFGGDANNVTIFGESAGGTSVYLLTASPLAKGLFQRAIMQSPWLDPGIFRNLTEESENGPPAESDGNDQEVKLLGENSPNGIAKLRAMPAQEILNKVKTRWPVATDGWIFPKMPYEIYASGEQHAIPIILGTNRDEGTMFAPRSPFGGTTEGFTMAMTEKFGEYGTQVAEFYAPKEKAKLREIAVQQITDTWFVQPAREVARAMDEQESTVWMYHFTKPVWGWMGAAHAAEIGYVFGNLEAPKEADSQLSDAFMGYWTQFAKTGNPNIPGKTSWPRFTTENDYHLEFNDELKVQSGLRESACDLLDEILQAKRPGKVSVEQ